ncbi:metalloregulator ArsR/SmtB family transcription factor [Cohnella sp. LGH]|uniref:ArsR/SmtB family transcription factor n=1 Tax=Cohnella sp. LGH TaxID=1619153 RepID=UPI001FFDEFA6|nr:metalloregulator ArsR/SmtB family transcription factor [Cohnella sp. LGH]
MKSNDICNVSCFDEHKVRRVKQSIQEDEISNMVKMFKILCDETRLKVVYALCQEDELCVCDVANIICSTMATTSHHLRSLKMLGIAKHRKEGKLVFYSLVDKDIRKLIEVASY